jgi:glutaredoxin 3
MVIIYGNQLCSWCKKAKKLAVDYNLQYEWRDTDEDGILNELKTKLPDAKTIPQIWWHGKYIGGYEDFVTELNSTIGGFGEGSF